jgi:hypothetical protein
VGILVKADDPQDRFAAGFIGVPSELTCSLLRVWPLALALDEVILDPSTSKDEINQLDDTRLELGLGVA